MPTQIPAAGLAPGAVTAEKIASGAVTSEKVAQGVAGGPKITNIQVTDSSYTVLDDTAVDLAGGYIKVTGTGFESGCSVVIGTTAATSTTFISATEVRAQVPAQSAGSYFVYVINTEGGTATRVNGLTYSASPTWVTASALANATTNVAYTYTLSATDATTYGLQAGSSLPSGATLTSGGTLSGTTVVANNTAYSFTVVATDAQNQDSPRTFNLNVLALTADPYWNNTTLLLNFNGSNNGTTITDSSLTNLPIYRYGNSVTKTDVKKFGTASYYNTGPYDYLLSFNDDAFIFGSSDFTLEAWVYRTQSQSHPYGSIFWRRDSFFLVAADDGLRAQIWSPSGTKTLSGGSGQLTLNTWHHVALVRNGSFLGVYLNGVNVGFSSIDSSAIVANSGEMLIIGAHGNAEYRDYAYVGYIDGLRITKGVARYTGNFTPPESEPGQYS